MVKLSNNKGFSLAETLIALGILAIGMLLIAGVFPVAIQLTTVSTERTTAAVVAQEAFAKVQLYAKGDPAKTNPGNDDIAIDRFHTGMLMDFNSTDIFPATAEIDENEFLYPSAGSNIEQKQYRWSALCRRMGPAADNPPVQVTVFVCRRAGRASQFYRPNDSGTLDWPNPNRTDWPVPCKINVQNLTNSRLRVTDPNEKTFVNDGCTIVDDASGQIYRVVRRLPATTANPTDDEIIQLDRDWQGGNEVWVVPPAIGGGRNPCIAVYQKQIMF